MIFVNTYSIPMPGSANMLRAAMQAWNAVSGCNIKFYEGYDVGVSFFNSPYGTSVLECDYPLSGKSGRFIRINNGNSYCPASGSDAEKYMFMHALARIIGFQPSPTWGIADGNTIPGTLPFEKNSIMVPDEMSASRTGFSANDIAAFKKVYPSPVPYPKITPAATSAMRPGRSYRFEATYGLYSCPNPVYMWTCKGSGDRDIAVQQAGNAKADVVFDQPGTYTLSARITNFGTSSISTTYTAVVSDSLPTITITPDITGVPEINKRYEISVSYTDPACPSPVFAISVTDLLSGNPAQLTQKGNGKADVVFTQDGQYRISARVTNASPQVTAVLDLPEIYIADPLPTITISPAIIGKPEFNKRYEISVAYTKPPRPSPVYAIRVTDQAYGNPAQLTQKGNGKADVVFTQEGQYRISAQVTNVSPQVTAFLDLPGIYRKYDRVYIKLESQEVDCFTMTGRGKVWVSTNRILFFTDKNLTTQIPYLDQSLSIRIKNTRVMYATNNSPEKITILQDEVKTIKGGASYDLERTTRLVTLSGAVVSREYYEVELISLND